MSKKTRSSRNKQSLWSNPTIMIALIGGIFTLVAAIISVSPQWIELTLDPTETATPTGTETALPTSPMTATPTEVLATETPTQVPPTPTETLTPTLTPITPPLSCLDRWELISSQAATPSSRGNCERYSYPDLGIEPVQNETLSFAKPEFQINETTGIVTELSSDVREISFNVELNNLVDGEFWIALSDDKNPESNSISLRLQPNGLVRIYDVNGAFYTEKTWNELRAGTIYGPSKPFNYKVVFKINGTSVSIIINDLPLNLSVNPDYLFFGYKNKSAVKPVTVFVTISNLGIK